MVSTVITNRGGFSAMRRSCEGQFTISQSKFNKMVPELQCRICEKSFDNRKACIRHASYCRKRALNPPKPRKKACIGCTKAKAFCDVGFPACSRCLDRNATCRYQNPQQSRRQTLLPSSPSSSFLNQFTDDSASQIYSYSDQFAFGGSTLRTELPAIDVPYLDEGLNDLVSIYQPAPPVIKSFWPRKMHFTDLSLNRKYVLVNLSSYPRMMLSGKKDSAPPFVHSQYLAKNLPDRKFASDSLARCAGVVAMWSVKNKDNSVHIWRAIRSEQERIFEECYDYNDWELAAALQAMCIYCILRILEKDENVTDFDIPLILTMTKVARRAEAQPTIDIRSEENLLHWENWIISESVRRTIFMIFIISSLFDVSAGLDHKACGSAGYLAEMPLPSTKNMWNSHTEAQWTQEYILSPVQSEFHQLLLFRDLISYQNYNDESDPDMIDNLAAGGLRLDHWLSHVDEIGTLVVTAAKFSDDAFSSL